MRTFKQANLLGLGLFVFLGLAALGYQLGEAAIKYKEYERIVTVKGLSEREYNADVVIWPIQFVVASNDLETMYDLIQSSTANITDFLAINGIATADISYSSPSITDKSARDWGNNARAEFRYSANQNVTVYSSKIDEVRAVMGRLSELGKKGIVFNSDTYQAQTEYLFTRLNQVKPDMVEEATRNAREVAQKFAADSQSSLGRIKQATQGQFSIMPRDKNNPHIKKVRVVSTIEYYLSD
ncbi:MAG: SIMPL domain-containing protein [Amphritea sp.]